MSPSCALAAEEAALPAAAASTRPATEEASARPAVEGADFNLHFDFVIVALPQAEALPLIEAMKDEAQMEKAYAKLMKMVGDRKADLVGMLTSIARPGLRTTAEDIEEIRYGTVYQPGQIAVPPEAATAGKKGAEAGPGTVEEKAKPKAPAEPELTAAIVESFETRNIGITLELEAEFDPKTLKIPLNYTVNHTILNGMAKISVVADGVTSVVEQPKILSNLARSQLDLVSGRRVLLGTFRAPAREGWMELFVLRATARAVK